MKNKRILLGLMLLIISLLAVGCGGGKPEQKTDSAKPAEQEVTDGQDEDQDALEEKTEEPEEPDKVTETDYMTIEGMYVDNSYSASDNNNVRFLYIFYTAHTDAENLQVDSKSMNITINDVNTYEAVRSSSQVQYMKSYYNSAYLEDVNVGDSVKFVETFEVPKGDLEKGRSITIEKDQIPDCEKLKLSTDDIVFCKSPIAIARKADPKGYKKERWARKSAPADVVEAVQNELNGFQWDVTANSIAYQIEFWAPNNYELRTAVNTSDGIYTVRNGYVICKNDIGGKIEIPFDYDNGKVDLHITDGFDMMK